MIADREGECESLRSSCSSVALSASPFQVQTRMGSTRQRLAVKAKAASEELGRERRWRRGSGVKAHVALHVGKNVILHEAQPTIDGATGTEMAR